MSDADISKQSIYNLNFQELKSAIASWGEPEYRANQIWHGVYRQLWNTKEAFTILPIILRERLFDEFSFSSLITKDVISSKDRDTTKTLFELEDNRYVETVWMRYSKRDTLCISSQSGCAMGCKFCATGQMGFKRNLTRGEIIEQVIYFARQLHTDGGKVSNVVIMGMGEPFHNYDAVIGAMEILNDSGGYNLGARRFTISTVGIIPAIERFTTEKKPFNLAVSLHAADDQLRSSLLPINNKYPLGELLDACHEYARISGRRITFEWALIYDVNDSVDQAKQLAQKLKGINCHVNVIPLNPTKGFHMRATTNDRAQSFKQELEQHGIPCTIRLRRGIEILAGCGQLAVER